MDGDKTTKGILNSDLPIPGADVPIIDLSLTTPTKSSTNYSKVCINIYFYFRNSYQLLNITFQEYVRTSKKDNANRKYQCKHCPEDFETYEGLSIHIANCHDMDVMVNYL